MHKEEEEETEGETGLIHIQSERTRDVIDHIHSKLDLNLRSWLKSWTRLLSGWTLWVRRRSFVWVLPCEASMAPAVSWKSSSCCRKRMACGRKSVSLAQQVSHLLAISMETDKGERLADSHCLSARGPCRPWACCTLYLDRSAITHKPQLSQ